MNKKINCTNVKNIASLNDEGKRKINVIINGKTIQANEGIVYSRLQEMWASIFPHYVIMRS